MTTATESEDRGDFGRFAPADYHIDSDGYIAFFSGFWAIDPERGKTKHAVTHDTIVDASGDVSVRINGAPLENVGRERGSYIR